MQRCHAAEVLPSRELACIAAVPPSLSHVAHMCYTANCSLLPFLELTCLPFWHQVLTITRVSCHSISQTFNSPSVVSHLAPYSIDLLRGEARSFPYRSSDSLTLGRAHHDWVEQKHRVRPNEAENPFAAAERAMEVADEQSRSKAARLLQFRNALKQRLVGAGIEQASHHRSLESQVFPAGISHFPTGISHFPTKSFRYP